MPFTDILQPERVQQAIAKCGVYIRHCIFRPLVTFYAFLAQVLSGDGSCRQATSMLLAWQGISGKEDGSVATGPYCKARAKLPETISADLARQVAKDLSRQYAKGKLLRGRPVRIVDGSTCSMPDTPENQAEYPQPRTQKRGLGFPIMRFVVVLCLGCGVALNAAVGPYLGKRTGETALLRRLEEEFEPGDIVLGDRYFCSYWQIARLLGRGVDCVFRMHQLRRIDFRKGERLGPWDHVAVWKKPAQPPEWMDRELYDSVPAELRIREVKRRIAVKGFRIRYLVLATTLLDSQLYPAAELAEAFRVRWQAEVDLRSIKVAMKMDVLRCKTPGMVHSEFWMHLLAYNLVRTVMARAADRHDRLPREISFTAAVQLLRSFAPLMALLPGEIAMRMHALLLSALSKEVVGDRPDRYEPRAIKRRPKPHRLLNEPREKARRKMERSAK
jgi:IS4 transposase